jgi:BirA family biotin operon repressor/biotin-[acetyl-CoA-carboxylase] ligase
LFTRLVGKRLLFFQEVVSTMDEASRLAESGTVEGTVVVAENQTAGRGRQGRNWVSRQGNIYLSVVFRPTPELLPMLSILAGVAVVRAIRKTSGLDPRIKWPNDIMIDGKKVSGILVESVIEGQTPSYAVLGIGINVDLDTKSVQEIDGTATAISAAAGHSVSREAILGQLLQDIDSLYLQAVQGAPVLPEWKSLLDTLGQRVIARWGPDSYSGVAEDIDELGNLVLRLDDGELITLTAGDVTFSNVETVAP